MPMYRRWWFWMLVATGIAGAFYFAGYIDWRGEQAPYDEYARMTAEYVAGQKAQSVALEKAYREDAYGGATPEETLGLYVEALEKGDFDLASKYYIPEEQADELSLLNETPDSVNKFIAILRFRKDISVSDDKQRAEVKFFDAKGIQTNVEFLKINPFTQKWKLYSNQ